MQQSQKSNQGHYGYMELALTIRLPVHPNLDAHVSLLV